MLGKILRGLLVPRAPVTPSPPVALCLSLAVSLGGPPAQTYRVSRPALPP